MTLCSKYMDSVETRFNRLERNYENANGGDEALTIFSHPALIIQLPLIHYLPPPPVHLNCNNREDQESSFEASDQNFHDDGLHYQSEDEDMHYEQGYEDNNDHGQDISGNNHEADNENEVEVSPTMQEDAPGSAFNYRQRRNMFASHGLSEVDLIALSGTHTMGFSQCSQFSKRMYNYNSQNSIDPTLNQGYAKQLQKACPRDAYPGTFYKGKAAALHHKADAACFHAPADVLVYADAATTLYATAANLLYATDVFANENMETYKDHILEHMKELWQKWRSDLLWYNVTKKKIILAATYKGKPPNGLDMNEWKWLIKEIYMKDDFRKRSARNTENRGYYAKELMPRTRSKPFRQVIWDGLGANKENQPTLVDVFYSTRKKGTELPNVETTQKLNEIRETMEKDPSLSHAEKLASLFLFNLEGEEGEGMCGLAAALGEFGGLAVRCCWSVWPCRPVCRLSAVCGCVPRPACGLLGWARWSGRLLRRLPAVCNCVLRPACSVGCFAR
uniref:peroxidase n=1 Tax=Chenopodium quinoa TaxID=63459 RepID=A0A803MYU9_CHEQI